MVKPTSTPVVECAPIIEYKISPWVFYPLVGLWKLAQVTIAVGLAVMLYVECLHNPNCNTVVTIFFALLSLAFLESAGFPIGKLIEHLKIST